MASSEAAASVRCMRRGALDLCLWEIAGKVANLPVYCGSRPSAVAGGPCGGGGEVQGDELARLQDPSRRSVAGRYRDLPGGARRGGIPDFRYFEYDVALVTGSVDIHVHESLRFDAMFTEVWVRRDGWKNVAWQSTIIAA
jgi:hypothetical protein